MQIHKDPLLALSSASSTCPSSSFISLLFLPSSPLKLWTLLPVSTSGPSVQMTQGTCPCELTHMLSDPAEQHSLGPHTLYSVKVVSASHPSRESLLTSSREEDVPPLFEWVTNKSNNISHLLEIWIYSIFQLHFDQFQENNVFHILTLYISLSTVRD